MTKARDIADGQSVDTTNFVTKSGGAIEALDGSALTDLTPANLDSTGTIPSQLLAGVGGGIKQAITGVITNGNANQTSSTFKSSTEAGGSGDVALTITPTATGSKLLVGIQCSFSTSTAGKTGLVAIYRGATKIAEKGILYQDVGSNINTGFYIECLDEPTIPETPTPITYTLKFACAQNNAQVNIHAESFDPARVTILEIAA